MQADVDGRITVSSADLPAGTGEHAHFAVGDYAAKAAVARVLAVGPERTSIVVLPGAEEDDPALFERRCPTRTG